MARKTPRIHTYVSGQPQKGKSTYVFKECVKFKEGVLFITTKNKAKEPGHGFLEVNKNNLMSTIQAALKQGKKLIYRVDYESMNKEIIIIVQMLDQYPKNVTVIFDECHNFAQEGNKTNPLFKIAQEGLPKVRAYYISQFPSAVPNRILMACESHIFFTMTPYEERYAANYFNRAAVEQIKKRLQKAGQYGHVKIYNGVMI